MIITLVKADFSANNIGSLDSWMVNRALGVGASYDGPNMVAKGSALNATITLADGYSVASAGVTITMGGVAIEGATVNGNIITIDIAEVTGHLLINIPTVSSDGVVDDVINAGLVLVQGYASADKIGVLDNRVRTDYLPGSYTIKLNEGYAIRMGISYENSGDDAGTAFMTTSTTTTEMQVSNPAKYSILTFTHYGDDANNPILPTEDIVDSIIYSNLNKTYEDIEIPAITQGYWLSSGHNTTATHRARAAAIQGPVLIECNTGYVVRGVCESANSDMTSGKDIVSNQALPIYEYGGSNWIGITFANASDSNKAIDPSADIIKSVKRISFN